MAYFSSVVDTDGAEARKARGAFFTPPVIASFITNWAVRDASDLILEPSAGDAEFLAHSVSRLRALGASTPVVHGVELHPWSAEYGAGRVRAAGGEVIMTISDFFDTPASGHYTAVIGNPPYIRFQDFAGEARTKARAAAFRGGVTLSGLASSWGVTLLVDSRYQEGTTGNHVYESQDVHAGVQSRRGPVGGAGAPADRAGRA